MSGEQARRSVGLGAWVAAPLLVLAAPGASQQDPDGDGDGLSDFHELHKYFTDPEKADSDGDGVEDGDWDERREYAYSIRTVLRVMPPYNLDAIASDDYQDARVRDETKEYVELEVVHYPLNTVADAIVENPRWRKDTARMDELEPGPSTNWDKKMRRDLEGALASEGVDLDALTDRQLVEKLAPWCLARTKSIELFTAYMWTFPRGEPKVHPELREKFANKLESKGYGGWTEEEVLANEILGREMYYNASRGTCTSSSVYMTTVMRAARVPTRMILCVPFVDASDPTNVELARKGLTHHRVRKAILDGIEPLGGSYAAHTFLEVFVGGRWRRLNYGTLGQNVLDPELFGLLTHVHTFHDLADANLAGTWGGPQRHAREVFRHANPYTALEVDDLFGAHCDEPNPPAPEDDRLTELTIARAYWLDSVELPGEIDRASFARDGSGHVLLHVQKPLQKAEFADYKAFWEAVGKGFRLVPETGSGEPLPASLERGFWLNDGTNCREWYLRIPPEVLTRMKKGAPYRLEPAGGSAEPRWRVSERVRITRE